MRCLLCFFIAFGLSLAALRAQNQLPEAKKIMGVINEESSWSPDGKTIAFDSSRPGKTSIFTWNVETREQKRLSEGNANDITPEWSPDGKQIAFVSDRTGHNEIYVMNVAGGDVRQVTNDKSDDIHPHWSPDGQRIIYCSARDNTDQSHAPEGEIYEIYTIKADGTDMKQVTNDKGINTYPSFSHDGRHIVFRKIIAPKNSEVFVMNADGTTVMQCTQSPSRHTSPKWSTDGKRISFDNASQVECDILVIETPQN